MKTKQELIQVAYKEHWDGLKDYINEDGWCGQYEDDDTITAWNLSVDYKNIDGYEWYRPTELRGIETNINEIKQIVFLCMNNDGLSCNINKQTIRVQYYDGWNTIILESWHTDEVMKKLDKWGYIPLDDLVDKVKELMC